MAFFKFPWPGRKEQDEKPARRSRAPQAESIEAMRRRARHRLIGATVLVLLGVVGFPLLFDTQPRPVPVDIPIEIPDRNKAPALAGGAGTPGVAESLADGEEVVAVAPAPAAKPTIPAPPLPVAVPKPEPKPAAAPAPRPEPKFESRPEPKPERKPEPKQEPKPEPKPVPAPTPARSDDAARARALLEGRSFEPAAASAAAPVAAQEARFIVQVGAFGDMDKAREVRAKLERAGLKTYAQTVDTKDGKRTRVRVGPFNNRTDADKAAARIKGLDLPASVLTL